MNSALPFCLAALLAAGAATATEFYVAPNGDDAHPGTKAKPFATLERARDAARESQIKNLKSGITVFLRGGVYRVEKTIEFKPGDSGTQEAPVTYAAHGNERPVISGGRLITGWQKGDGHLWQTTVPAVKEGRWYFNQLFVNDRRRTRARTPNKGFLYTEGILAPINRSKWSGEMKAKHGFLFRDHDIQRWHNFNDAVIVIYHSWTTSMHLITGLDPVERVVHVAPPSRWPIGYWWEYNTRYHVENIFEALDEPGEWYLDRTTGVLSYWPMPGENMRSAEVVAPVVRQTLVAFRGDPAKKQYVENLRFKGLSFQHTDYLLAPDMPLDEQGAIERSPMIDAKGLRHALFENCEIAHAGENALWLDSGCADNVLRHCHIRDIGGSAVFIGPKQWRNTPEELVERNVVDNCFIHDGSHIFLGSQGVWIGNAFYNEVTHNEICDFAHLGISVGHSWGYAPSSANHNRIAFNHVHHICNGFFSDGGGIYTLGISPGTVICNNIVHDVVPTPQMPVGGTGIYLDEGSSDILVESNIVYRVGAGAFNQHYGKDNLVRNNIFAFGGRNPITSGRPEEHLSFTFEGNIALSSQGQATADHYSPMKSKTAFRHNLYWDTSTQEPLFSGVSFAGWQRTGRDKDSIIADPQFYDAAHGDFRLKKTSPAPAMGFHPIDSEHVGLYGSAAWVNAPKRIQRAPLPDLPPLPPAPPPRPLAFDFESDAVGKQPEFLSCTPAGRADVLHVTDETAAGGRKCLKFTKGPNLKHSWEPHACYGSNRYTNGCVRVSCDLQISAAHPADAYIGVRDWSSSGGAYREGASLQLKADGALSANGKSLTKVAVGRWVHFEIQTASADYRLAITVAGEKEQVFEHLPYANPEFRYYTWFGFSAVGQPGSVFYVDNIRIEPLSR